MRVSHMFYWILCLHSLICHLIITDYSLHFTPRHTLPLQLSRKKWDHEGNWISPWAIRKMGPKFLSITIINDMITHLACCHGVCKVRNFNNEHGRAGNCSCSCCRWVLFLSTNRVWYRWEGSHILTNQKLYCTVF